MPTGQSSRLALPLLAAGQAQKETTHNEALILLDLLTHPVVESAELTAPPATPVTGQMWLVPDAPTGVWSGQAGRLAAMTEGGWRYIDPFEGLILWDKARAKIYRFHEGDWIVPNNIAEPAGGTVVDVEARATIANIAALLVKWGLA